jgi:hypothetical protein
LGKHGWIGGMVGGGFKRPGGPVVSPLSQRPLALLDEHFLHALRPRIPSRQTGQFVLFASLAQGLDQPFGRTLLPLSQGPQLALAPLEALVQHDGRTGLERLVDPLNRPTVGAAGQDVLDGLDVLKGPRAGHVDRPGQAFNAFLQPGRKRRDVYVRPHAGRGRFPGTDDRPPDNDQKK